MDIQEPVVLSAVIVITLMATSVCYCVCDRLFQLCMDAHDARAARATYPALAAALPMFAGARPSRYLSIERGRYEDSIEHADYPHVVEEVHEGEETELVTFR